MEQAELLLFSEVKLYLQTLNLNQDCKNKIELLFDKPQLHRKVKDSTELLVSIFSLIKENIESAKDLQEIQYHIIMMKNSIPRKYIEQYLINLSNYFMPFLDFNIETYTCLRHCYYHKDVSWIIATLMNFYAVNENQYHQEAIKIYCLEQRIKQAYPHIYQLEGNIEQKYLEILKNYHPFKYLQVTKNKKQYYKLAY